MEARQIRALVGKQMLMARQLRGLGLRDAARRIGISHSFLKQIEDGDRNLSLELLFKASKVYGVKVDVILGRSTARGKRTGGRAPTLLAKFFSIPS